MLRTVPAKRITPEQEAEDVLRRPGKVRASDLIRLIHEVNPTGLDLPPDLERRRYELKSRLQSALVRHFRDDLSITPVPNSEGVVELRYRPQDRDACHAVVLALDDEARSIVRFAIDTGAQGDGRATSTEALTPGARRPKRSSGIPRAPTASTRDARELVRLGTEALDTYDFETARGLFEEALETSEGGEAAAVALLELLIDHLAAYEDALAVEDRLSSSAARSANVRSLLAYAAAQSGRSAAAQQWLKGTAGPRALETTLLLARHALTTGDCAAAERLLGEARKHATMHPDLPALEAEVTKARATLRHPAEAELETLASSPDADEAEIERRARALLDAWPDSALGRRVLRELEGRRRSAEAGLLRAQGEEAFSRGELDQAERLWTSAQALGAEGLEPRLGELRRRLQERAAEAKVEEISTSLLAELTARTLLRYSESDERTRERLRDRVRLPELQWMEALGPPSHGREAAEFAEAVVALSRAAGGNEVAAPPDTVLSLLAPHEAIVRRVRLGRELLESARSTQLRNRIEAAERGLDDARRSLEAGRGVEALAMAEHVLHRAPAHLRARAEALCAEAADAARLQRLLDRVDADIAEGKLFNALNALRTTEDPATGGALRTRLELRRREVRASAAKAMALDVCDDVAEPAPEFAKARLHTELGHWLDATGHTFYWVFAHGRWLFIERYAVARSRPTTVASLRTPEPMGFCSGQLAKDILVICSDRGAVLELSCTDWTVRSWQGSSTIAGPEEILDGVLTVPGSRSLWVTVRESREASEKLVIFDVDRRRVQRRLEAGPFPQLLTGGTNGPCVVAYDFGGPGRLLTATGTLEAALPAGIEDLARVPGSPSFVGVSRQEAEDEESAELELVLVSASGQLIARRPLENAWADLQRALASSQGSGLTYLLHDTGERTFRSLMAFSVDGDALSAEWGCGVHADSGLVQDVVGQHVALVVPAEDGALLLPLGKNEPGLKVTERSRSPGRSLLAATGELFCGRPPPPDDAARALTSILGEPDRTLARIVLRETLKRWEREPALLYGFARMLEHGPGAHLRNEVLEFVRERHPDAAATKLHDAEAAYGRRDWDALRELTEALDVGALDERLRAHALHLLGLAQYHQGELTKALATFTRAAGMENDESCNVLPWVEWLTMLTGPSAPQAEDEGEATPMAHLLRAIRSADACWRANDAAGVLRSLDIAAVWDACEVQSLGRLAAAAFTVSGASPVQTFRKRLILSAFVELAVRLNSFGLHRCMPLGPDHWTDDRIAELAVNARGWLSRQCEP